MSGISRRLIVCVDISDDYASCMVVGEQKDNIVYMVNDIRGKEAEELYERLTNTKIQGGNKNE